jgi:hypothetical protein
MKPGCTSIRHFVLTDGIFHAIDTKAPVKEKEMQKMSACSSFRMPLISLPDESIDQRKKPTTALKTYRSFHQM